MDKTEYEESVTKMITDYKELVEKIIKSIEDQHTQERINEILDTEFTKSTIHTNNKKTYRQLLLDDNFNIDRVMRIERKDDTYAVGLAMADFSAYTIMQLMAFGKYDALDKLIHSLSYTVQNLDKLPKEVKDSLHSHLVNASIALGCNQNNYSYEEVMEHLYDFVDEVNTIESKVRKRINMISLISLGPKNCILSAEQTRKQERKQALNSLIMHIGTDKHVCKRDRLVPILSILWAH